jgi:hypothetical protein
VLSIKIQTVADAIVRQFLLDPGGRDNEALHIAIDASISDYEGNESFSDRRGLHLLYYLPKGYASVTVFSAITRSPFTKPWEVGGMQWEHETTHDSCWRDVRVFSELYFDMCQCINDDRANAGLEAKAPALMTENNHFRLFGNLFDWIPVEVSTDPNDKNNYQRLVKVSRKPLTQ